jgi:hypothetical protein
MRGRPGVPELESPKRLMYSTGFPCIVFKLLNCIFGRAGETSSGSHASDETENDIGPFGAEFLVPRQLELEEVLRTIFGVRMDVEKR